jgi:hypothetical protein
VLPELIVLAFLDFIMADKNNWFGHKFSLSVEIVG